MNARRGLALLPAAGAVAACCVAVFAVPADSGARRVLPDISPQVPQNVKLRFDEERRVFLGFRSAADNIGRGPLVVDGVSDPRAPGELTTTQVISRVDGTEERRPLLARLRYTQSPDHSHFHYVGFMRYQLRGARTGKRVGLDRKTGFCLGDRYEIHRGERAPGKPRRAFFRTNCGKDRPDATKLREGISPGYGDDYNEFLEGQEIEVTGVRPGRYVLVHTLNPDRTLLERRYGNNSSSALILLSRLPNGTMRVRVLATCRATSRCRA